MTSEAFTLTVHMASSLDGYIAGKSESYSWLETTDRYEKGADAEDPEAFIRSIGCFVMGSRTYELALRLGWPYGEIPVIVLTHRELAVERSSVELYSGDPRDLVANRLRSRYRSAWLVGGSSVVRDFIRLQLVDEVRMSILPILLGDGLPFFDHVGRELPLHLKDSTAYKNGVVELWYEIRKR
jgi:dihydrofolate reductase